MRSRSQPWTSASQRREQRDLAVSTGSPELGMDMEVLERGEHAFWECEGQKGSRPYGSARDEWGGCPISQEQMIIGLDPVVGGSQQW